MSQSDDIDKQKNDDLEIQVNQALDDSIESLEPDVRRRLNQIRIEAIDKKAKRFRLLRPVAVFSLALALFVGWQMQPVNEDTLIDDFAVMTEDLEMLEDLEFAYWMAEESELASL